MEKSDLRFKDFLRPERKKFTASVILAVLSVFFGIIPYVAVWKLLMMISEPPYQMSSVWICVIVAMSSFVLQIVFRGYSTATSHRAAFSIMERIRLAVTRKMTRMSLGYTQSKGSGYFKNLIIDEVEKLEYPLAHAIPETSSGIILPAAVMVILAFTDWRLALAAALPVLVTLAFYIPAYRRIMNDFSDTYYITLDNMNARVIEYIRGIKEIKIFKRGDHAFSKYKESIDEYETSTLEMYGRMYRVAAPAEVILASVLVSVLCVGGYLFVSDEISLSLLLLCAFLSLGIGGPLLKFNDFLYNFFNISNGRRLIDEFLSQPELPQVYGRDETDGYGIAIDNVSFAYGEENVLRNVSFSVPEGKKTALVGPSGSGKSTLANLLARFWDVGEGSIRIGDSDIRDMPLGELMNKISYVTQDTFLFNTSIRENIRMGRPDATEEDIVNAAKAAHCDDFIQDLEDGYDTVVGDEGSRLSGGQRQRVVIARAILRNAPILILDEATAYADMENQNRIQGSLQTLCADKTLVIIAHRLTTVMDCDQIVVMQNGEVESVGTHAELLDMSQVYGRLWKASVESRDWSVERTTEAE